MIKIESVTFRCKGSEDLVMIGAPLTSQEGQVIGKIVSARSENGHVTATIELSKTGKEILDRATSGFRILSFDWVSK